MGCLIKKTEPWAKTHDPISTNNIQKISKIEIKWNLETTLSYTIEEEMSNLLHRRSILHRFLISRELVAVEIVVNLFMLKSWDLQGRQVMDDLTKAF